MHRVRILSAPLHWSCTVLVNMSSLNPIQCWQLFYNNFTCNYPVHIHYKFIHKSKARTIDNYKQSFWAENRTAFQNTKVWDWLITSTVLLQEVKQLKSNKKWVIKTCMSHTWWMKILLLVNSARSTNWPTGLHLHGIYQTNWYRDKKWASKLQ